MTLAETVSQNTRLPLRSVQAVLELLDQDCTVPFIARYRKEATGNLDEVAILQIRDEAERVRALEKRRTAVLDSLKELGVLTPELERALSAALTLSEIEDLYLPYRPKRKTRASVALEKGLGALADTLGLNRAPSASEIEVFVDPERGVATAQEAIQGAQDIVAERLSESASVRGPLRVQMAERGVLSIKKARGAAETSEFREFFGKAEPLSRMPSHRLLAVLRGVAAGDLSVSLDIEEASVLTAISRSLSAKSLTPLLHEAALDSWKRLVQPSLENELLAQFKRKADEQAVEVFAKNLRELLLAAPLGQKVVLAVDPGFRTGCKVVVLSAQGALLEHSVIFPHEPQKKTAEAASLVQNFVKKYRVEAVAVGNGTAGRETMEFLKTLSLPVPVVSVSESGASIYSASEIARQEFPDLDLTVRGAVSIGRRLLDPLAELVKIDPKSIGVGQYQHDVDQTLLKSKLDDTVSSCVNAVGVDVNTASVPLLASISGLTSKLSASIIDHRVANGPFRSRADFRKVKGFGPKAFEQAAGFLRIRNAENPLDASAVHPESYPVVDRIAKTLGTTVRALVGSRDVRSKVSLDRAPEWGVGTATLSDIVQELEKPGLDPRQEFEVWEFDARVHAVEDLSEGMVLPAIVTNVTDFGAFADIGVHQDGLIHVSQLSDAFVKHPSEVVRVGQKVRVRVVSVDKERRRIGLSLKNLGDS